MIHKKAICSLVLMIIVINTRAQRNYVLTSPDKTMAVTINAGDSITYQVTLDGKLIIGASRISFQTDATKPRRASAAWKVSKAQNTSHDEWLIPVVYQKSARVHDLYNQLHLDF